MIDIKQVSDRQYQIRYGGKRHGLIFLTLLDGSVLEDCMLQLEGMITENMATFIEKNDVDRLECTHYIEM
jgi:hypothetical protein